MFLSPLNNQADQLGPYQSLVGAVIRQCVVDALSESRYAVSAREWLSGSELRMLVELMGLDAEQVQRDIVAHIRGGP